MAMSWQDFVAEFRTMYYNREILAAQQDEFTSLKQGTMTVLEAVLEAVKKFEQLARLCPELVPNETEKVRRMMKMFRRDIAKQVNAGSSPPTLLGKNKRKGNVTGQGQQRNYPQKKSNRGNEGSQLHAAQVKIEGHSITQGRLEAPEHQARIYAYTMGDAEAGTSHVVTG
ncbi:hypothetical protein TIFTF001_053119 [Ficus carica]|uniref:Retrotransposon gag domain-containing protein n=1 Tax=Ficus carica TaxID=3494 RepID=A0AA88EFU6_FICCA|nr:hypothetical protein TIFTF001_053119 [Ficus carica]